MPRDSLRDVTRTRDRAARDSGIDTFKRRIQRLAKLDGTPVVLAEGVFLVQTRGIRDPAAAIERLREHGRLDLETLKRTLSLTSPPVPIDTQLLAAVRRELRVLDPALAARTIREHRKALGRLGRIDAEWFEARRVLADRAAAALAATEADDAASANADVVPAIGTRETRFARRWFEGILDLVGAIHGPTAKEVVREMHARVTLEPAERRQAARRRVDTVAHAFAGGDVPDDPEIADHVTALEAARDLEGRARRRKVLAVLRRVVEWPEAPSDFVSTIGSPDAPVLADAIRDAGRGMAHALPTTRDPTRREVTLDLLATFALAFDPGDTPTPLPTETTVADLREKRSIAADLHGIPLTFAQAIAFVALPLRRYTRTKIARFVAEGLELELVALACEKGLEGALVSIPDVRSARAYATWATRLAAHYESLGITFSLPAELFENLPRNEDLAVLAMCLMEHTRELGGESKPPNADVDPLATLDATLALFKKLPRKARSVVSRLRDVKAGEGARLFPDVAAWLGDDALLDRYVHVVRIAGEPATLSNRIREDFEHAERTRGELRHLETLGSRNAPQEGRLEALRRAERTLEQSPRGRTKRRLQERIDALLPTAYRAELDATFREILREAWGIAIPSLTPAWRDAIRFWLVVDDNRELLGQLLRAVARQPGDVTTLFPKNVAWIDAARKTIDVDAWLAPRRRDVTIGEARFTIALEEDPLEVLRMGIPFGTCLSLEDGCNAASTILNALDANKRVIYVRGKNGKIVARKLLALTADLHLLGYNLYVATAGEGGAALRGEVLRFCADLAREVGATPIGAGTPPRIHQGFWYDDGPVPFATDPGVEAYTDTLGLPAPPEVYSELVDEVKAWRARESDDVATAIAVLRQCDQSLSQQSLRRWLIATMPEREVLRVARDDDSVGEALVLCRAEDGEAGVVRALELASRVRDTASVAALALVLAPVVRSQRVAEAIVDLATRAADPRRDSRLLLVPLLSALPDFVAELGPTFDLLDRADALWDLLVTEYAQYQAQRTAMLDAIVRVFEESDADDDAILACLSTRHRSTLARRLALALARRRPIGSAAKAERALARFATLCPDLATAPEGIAAFVRQARTASLDKAQLRKIPTPAAPPFEALGPMLFAIDGLAPLLARSGELDLETWMPGPWELAWLRRNPRAEENARLFDLAALNPRKGSRPMELLALLADTTRLAALEELAKSPPRREEVGPKPRALLDPSACRKVGRSLAQQARRSLAIPDEDLPVLDPDLLRDGVDIAYVTLGARILRACAIAIDDPRRGWARAVLLAGPTDAFDWVSLAREVHRIGDTASAARLLADRIEPRALPGDLAAELWEAPALRDAIAKVIAKDDAEGWWSRRARGIELATEARGADASGIFTMVVAALGAKDRAKAVALVPSTDDLRVVVRALLDDLPPSTALELYAEFPDALSASVFVKAVRRLPRDRAAALREAAQKTRFDGDHGAALKAWLLATRTSS